MNVNMFDHPAVRENLRHPAGARRGRGRAGRRATWPAAGSGKGRLAEVDGDRGRGLARARRARRDLERRDRARDRGPDASRTSTPCASSPTARRGTHGLSPGRGRARPRRARRPRLGSDGARRAACGRRRSSRVRSAEEMARGGRASTRRRPRSWPWPRRVSDYRPAERAPLEAQEDDGGAHARPRAHAGHPARAGRGEGRRASWSASPPRPSDVLENARGKREAKNARPAGGERRQPPRARASAARRTRPCSSTRRRRDASVPLTSKRALADRIWDRVIALRAAAPTRRRAARRASERRRSRTTSLADLRERARVFRGADRHRRAARRAGRAPRCRPRRRAPRTPAPRVARPSQPGRRTALRDLDGRARRARRLPALQARGRAQDDRVRPGQPGGRADVRRRGAGRRRGRAGARLRRPRRPAAHRHHREGHEDPARRRLHRERPEVPAAPEPQPRAGRDPVLPALPREADRAHPAARARRPRQVRARSGCCKTTEPISRLRGRIGRLRRHQGDADLPPRLPAPEPRRQEGRLGGHEGRAARCSADAMPGE